MTDINTVIVVGRLTRDAELKYTTTGTAVSHLSIAVNRSRKTGDQWTDEVSYFDVTLWGKSAESLQQYLIKGKQIAVEGELRQERWEKDGQKQSKVTINARNLQLLGGGSGGGGTGRPPQKQTGGYSPEASSEEGADYHEKFEDDIPF
ncbi:MAG: single-stranded DNA-binding protein [Spirochaetales bacterium]|nr:MAG: single-stranded DNA-binding protein [Spirochaetales bacterium]